MADRIVTHTFRNTEGDILAIGNPNESWHQRHREWAISDLVAGRHRYFVHGSSGLLRPIDVISHASGPYLRARADSETDNNLDNMPLLNINPWEVVLDSAEILVVHAALVPHGEEGQVLFMGGSEHNPDQASDFDNTRLYNVTSNELFTIEFPESAAVDLFCCEHAFLPDGRLLVGGGTESWVHTSHMHDAHDQAWTHWSGSRACAIYNIDGTWESSASLLPEPGQATRGGGRWYPTLLTLGDGDILAVGGHPTVRDENEPGGAELNDSRHGAWLPERYNSQTDTWTYQPGHWLYVDWSQLGSTDPENPDDDGEVVELPEGQLRGTVRNYRYYPRLYQVPDGRVFMASPNNNLCGWYNPTTGLIDEPSIPAPEHSSADNYRETNHTAVLLPLLPGDNYQAHVLFLGLQGPRRISLDSGDGDTTPVWLNTSIERDWQDEPPLRRHGCATLLPTGDVIFTGGINHEDVNSLPDTEAVRAAEIYRPGIDWDGQIVDFIEEEWITVAEATVPRNYHSVALLLPNGRILTAGSNLNGAIGGNDLKEYRVEVYTPDYYYDVNRPVITSSPSTLSYGESFTINTTRHNQIQRIALMRCGTVTHAWDGDQRYVGLEFSVNETGLNVTSPPNGNIAPPGPYMLWVIDDESRPCRIAPFVLLN